MGGKDRESHSTVPYGVDRERYPQTDLCSTLPYKWAIDTQSPSYHYTSWEEKDKQRPVDYRLAFQHVAQVGSRHSLATTPHSRENGCHTGICKQ